MFITSRPDRRLYVPRLAGLTATCLAAGSLSLALGGTAHAAESMSTTSNRSSFFSLNWNFGNNSTYGTNRTKGSGVIKEESRAVANFSRVLLALPAKITLSQGPTESLSISTDDNLLPLMTTRVENGELIIEGDKSRGFSTNETINIRLTVKSLNALKIQGSGDIVGDQIKSDKLDIAIAGSGDVRFNTILADQLGMEIKGSGDVKIDNVASKAVTANIHGSGDIRMPTVEAMQVAISIKGSGDVSVGGRTDKVAIEVMGSGDVRAKRLLAREANASVMASGDIEVHAKEKLTATVSGSGDIRYAGSPASVTRSVRGSGSIEAL